MRQRTAPARFSFAAALLPFWVLVVLPFAASLFYALLYSLGLAGLLSAGFTLASWRRVLGSGEVWASFLYSARLALVSVAIATAVALWLARRLRGRLEAGMLLSALQLPLVMPSMVAAFLALQLLSGAGLLARLLAAVGLIGDPQQMPELVLDPWGIGIVLVHAALAVPFLILLFHQLYQSENVAALRQLATSLGASEKQNLFRVEIPLLLRAAAGNLALLAVLVLGSYEVPLLLGRQSPQMLSVLIVRHFSLYDLAKKPEAYTLALLYSLLVVAAMLLAWRRSAADES